jgi:antirestriction protein ArdC
MTPGVTRIRPFMRALGLRATAKRRLTMTSIKQNGPDVYDRITQRIVEAIEAGAGDFRMPWHHDGDTTTPVNIASKAAYRGINTLALWVAGQASGYSTGIWGTYRQWAELGAQVRKGERGSCVVFWKMLDRTQESQDGSADSSDETGNRRMFARAYTVFNADQVDGYTPPPPVLRPEPARIEHAERFCGALGVDIRHGGDRAYYRPSTDHVQMPELAAFHNTLGYYATLLHECGHASGAKHRLDRDLSGRFGSEAYAMEEIIVELLSAMVCADLGLAVEPRPDHAAYIASWLKVLKNDKRAIFTAAGKAQQIADWMHAHQTPQQAAA